MTTRTEFRSQLTAYSKRPDISSEQLDQFLDSALSDLSSRLRTAEQEISLTLTLSAGVGALPADFSKMREVSSSTGRRRTVLEPGSRRVLAAVESTSRSIAGDEVSHYGISNKKLNVPLGGDSDVDIIYWQRIELPLDTSEHAVTDANPQLLIFQALFYLHQYVGDTEAARNALGSAERAFNLLDGEGSSFGVMGGAN